jgi:hypothetical protein
LPHLGLEDSPQPMCLCGVGRRRSSNSAGSSSTELARGNGLVYLAESSDNGAPRVVGRYAVFHPGIFAYFCAYFFVAYFCNSRQSNGAQDDPPLPAFHTVKSVGEGNIIARGHELDALERRTLLLPLEEMRPFVAMRFA